MNAAQCSTRRDPPRDRLPGLMQRSLHCWATYVGGVSGSAAFLPAHPEQAADAPRASSTASERVRHGAVILYHHRKHHCVVGQARDLFAAVRIGENVNNFKGLAPTAQLADGRCAIGAIGFDVDPGHRRPQAHRGRSARALLRTLTHHPKRGPLLNHLVSP